MLTLKFSPSIFKNKYTVTNPGGSSVINLISVNTAFFPGIYIGGEAWAFRYIGLDFLYNMGFLKLNVTPPSGTAFSVNTKFYQMGTGLKGRIFFMKREKSPYAFARIGYT